MDIKAIRDQFPMLNKTMQGHPLCYFDNAATTFKPKRVIEVMNDYYSNYTANTGRGDYDLEHITDEKFAEARRIIANFINADEKEVVFTSGASMSINLLAFGYGKKFLTKDDEILITQAEHASNVLPWFKVRDEVGCQVNFIPLDHQGRLTPENLRKTISKKTKIVAVAHVTNVMAYHLDIKEIAKIVHEYDAVLVVDGAQSVPHLPTDVQDLDIDFLSFSGHKMCGPTGIGILYGKYALLEKTDPFMTGGGMSTGFDMCGDASFMKPPFKFEAGTQNIAGAIGLGEAVRFIQEIGIKNIAKYEAELRQYAINKMKELPNIEIYNPDAEGGIITFNVKDVFAQDAATHLNSKGICVRSGQHCAKILIDYLGVVATLRFSLYFYNTTDEIDAFIEALKTGGDFLDAYFT
ncbi:MAG TPA: cysteine desulfurase [Firmicutes bacterium]|jgi:cysteine desulfurase/selenocysteine lyase|nr:cysteine desulfurase [Bacillota bacterium]